uniref:Acyltransferase 3 domain-containing protein n=1 Tax=Zooxanthella nutricula TaxID=1333877 RepID=A0A7S2VT15_9DINO
MLNVRLFLPGMGWRLFLEWWPVAVPASGEAGVDIFLVLSGFLIGSALQREIATTGGIAFGTFCLRRAFRIFPAIVSAAIATAVKNLVVGEPLECPNAAWSRNAVMFNNWPGAPVTCLGHTWSVALELQLYLATPLLLWASSVSHALLARLLPGSKVSAASVTAALCLGIWLACAALRLQWVNAARGSNLDTMALYFSTHFRCATYVAGVLAGVTIASLDPKDFAKAQPPWIGVLATAALSTSFVVVAFACFVGADLSADIDGLVVARYRQLAPGFAALHQAFLRPLFGAALGCIMFLCAVGLAPLTRAFLAWAGWRPLAGLSYSMYLLQYVGFPLLEKPFLSWVGHSLLVAPLWLGILVAYVAVALFIIAAVPLAFLNYALVELPGIAAGKRVAEAIGSVLAALRRRHSAAGEEATGEASEERAGFDLEGGSGSGRHLEVEAKAFAGGRVAAAS